MQQGLQRQVRSMCDKCLKSLPFPKSFFRNSHRLTLVLVLSFLRVWLCFLSCFLVFVSCHFFYYFIVFFVHFFCTVLGLFFCPHACDSLRSSQEPVASSQQATSNSLRILDSHWPWSFFSWKDNKKLGECVGVRVSATGTYT